MLSNRLGLSFDAWGYASKMLSLTEEHLDISDRQFMKNVTNKWLRNWTVILIIVFVATPGGGYSPVQKLCFLEMNISHM